MLLEHIKKYLVSTARAIVIILAVFQLNSFIIPVAYSFLKRSCLKLKFSRLDLGLTVTFLLFSSLFLSSLWY